MGSPGARARLKGLPSAALALACAALGCAHWSGAAHPPRFEPDPPAVKSTSQVAGAPTAPSHQGQAGVFHTVKAGETLYRIGRSYGVPIEVLARENAIDDAAIIEEGRVLFIPGAHAQVAVPEPDQEQPIGARRSRRVQGQLPQATGHALDPAAHGSALAWPVRGVLFSGFGPRARDQHDGIDLAAPEGTPVLAAAAGTVIYAGEQRGYGQIVLIAHDGPLQGVVTVYAHNSRNLVASGDHVERGQPVAKIGHSGNATGPHLHFEVRVGARPHDPLGFLR